MVVLVVFPLLARPAPVSTKYHTIAGILDATVTLCRQSLPAARPQPFLVLSVYSPSIQASLRAAASRPYARLDAGRPSAGRPLRDLLPDRWQHAQRTLRYRRYSRRPRHPAVGRR